MDADEEQPPGPGDEPEDDQPGPPWLPPDDRLWRHPSEVRVNPATTPQAETAGVLGAWARRVELRVWFLGLVPASSGALICTAVLVATGAIGTQPAVLTRDDHGTGRRHADGDSQPTRRHARSCRQVAPSVVGLSVNGAQGVESGSGIIVSTTNQYCYVLTDSALFQEAGPNSQVQVVSSSGQTKAGYLVGSDPSSGIAVVRVVFLPLNSQSTVDLGSVANIETGEEVYLGRVAVHGRVVQWLVLRRRLHNRHLQLPATGERRLGRRCSRCWSPTFGGPSAYGGAGRRRRRRRHRDHEPGDRASARAGLTYVTPIDTAMADVSSMIKYGQPAPHPWFGVLQANDVSGPGLPHASSSGSSRSTRLPRAARRPRRGSPTAMSSPRWGARAPPRSAS